jgi:hypothetical protein
MMAMTDRETITDFRKAVNITSSTTTTIQGIKKIIINRQDQEELGLAAVITIRNPIQKSLML